MIIKKHQDLVHKARYSLSIPAIKMISHLIASIRVDDSDFELYTFKISEVEYIMGAKTKNIKHYFDDAIGELHQKPFKIGHKQFNWISYSEHIPKSGEVIVGIDVRLRPYLLELKSNFLTYNIKNILLLKSSRIIKMYEVFKDHLSSASRYKQVDFTLVTMDMEEIRDAFSIPPSYRNNDIKRVFDSAIVQFKTHTDIAIKIREIKRGRKITAFEVTVFNNDLNMTNTIHGYIDYVRKNLVNADLLKAKDKKTNKIMNISVSTDGRLYDKNGINFDSGRAKEIWSSLYESRAGLL